MKKTLLCCLVLFLLVGCRGNSTSSSSVNSTSESVNSTSESVNSTSEPNEYSKLNWSDEMVVVFGMYLFPDIPLFEEVFFKMCFLSLFDPTNDSYPEKRYYPTQGNTNFESLIVLDKDYKLISIEEITANDLVSYFVSDDEKTLYVKLLENREYRDYKTEYEKSGNIFREYYDIDVKVDENSLPYFLLSDGSKVVINEKNYAPLPYLVEGKGEYWYSNNVIYDLKDYGYMYLYKHRLD